MASKHATIPKALMLIAGSILMMAALPKECLRPGVAPNHMALDANVQTDDVQVVTDVVGSDPFTVSINLTRFGDIKYYGYQWEVQFPTDGLGYLGGVVENVPATGLQACILPQIDQSAPTTRVFAAGCLGGENAKTSTFKGEFTRFQMQCLNNGAFEVVLPSLADEPIWGTTVYASRNQFGDPDALPTSTSSVTVHCSGIDPPLPPPPPPPPAPVGTSTDATMIVDADPGSTGLQASRDVSGDFSIALYGSDVGGASGYQWEIEWDDPTLDLVSAQENTTETEAYLCTPVDPAGPPIGPPGKQRAGGGAGCNRLSGTFPPEVKFTTITLRCVVTDGRITPVHLVTGDTQSSEDPIFGSVVWKPGGTYLATSYVDAQVRCGTAAP